MKLLLKMLIISIFWLFTIYSAFSLDVSPSNPNPGDKITINGSASSPNQAVSLRSSFGMNLPVSSGQYDYATTVAIPQTPNRIKVTARNVKDFNAGVKLGIWITKSFSASSGTVSLSQADVPAGSYSLKMFGEALPGSTTVPVSVEAETEVKSDSQGQYTLDIDTSGIPAGEYRIEAAGETKTIQIGRAYTADTIQVNTPEKPVKITPQVVGWYANKTGLEINNSSQFEKAEKLLQKMIDDGYWKIISRGEPLTEKAGNCLQEFCLVRDNGACTICREKDILLKSGSTPNLSIEKEESSANQSTSQTADPKEKSFWNKIIEWISSWQGILAGVVANSI